VLLIVAALTDAELSHLLKATAAWELAALVEAHDPLELRRAVDAGAVIIGVNNRSLRTLDVSTATAADLASAIPDGCVAVAESGLKSGEDLRRMRDAGYDAFLVGERVVSAPDPGAALSALLASAEAADTAGTSDSRGTPS
jgi:indole-3-glycerol phosphate synthase